MKGSTRMASGAVVIVLGALVAIAPRFLFPVCEYFDVRMQLPNGSTDHMHCFYTARASLLIGLIISVIGLAIMLARNADTTRLLSLVLAAASIAVILVPTVFFPICQNADMHCNKGTKPLLIVLGIVSLMVAGFVAFASRKPPSQFSAPSSQQD